MHYRKATVLWSYHCIEQTKYRPKRRDLEA